MLSSQLTPALLPCWRATEFNPEPGVDRYPCIHLCPLLSRLACSRLPANMPQPSAEQAELVVPPPSGSGLSAPEPVAPHGQQPSAVDATPLASGQTPSHYSRSQAQRLSMLSRSARSMLNGSQDDEPASHPVASLAALTALPVIQSHPGGQDMQHLLQWLIFV